MKSQIPIRFSPNKDISETPFFISKCNQNAFGALNDIGSLESKIMTLRGEKNSGKQSLLKEVFSAQQGFMFLPYNKIDEYLEIDESKNVIFEKNINKLDSEGQEKLFHLYNKQKNGDRILILKSEISLGDIELNSNDLHSRLSSLPCLQILPPDKEMIEFLLLKFFAERQIKVSSDVIEFISSRVNRTFADVSKLSEKLDKKSIEMKRNITIPFVKEILGI